MRLIDHREVTDLELTVLIHRQLLPDCAKRVAACRGLDIRGTAAEFQAA